MTDYLPPLGDQQTGAMLSDIQRQLNNLRTRLDGLVVGAVDCFSTSHPPNPAVGMQIYEQDTGLTATWSGTAWTYPPQLITSVVLSASQTSVTLPQSGSIPQVFKNLRLIVAAKSSGTTATSLDAATLQFNATTSGYNWNSIQATQTASAVTVANGASASASQCMQVWNNFHTSAGRGLATIDIPNYSGTSNFKGFVSQCSATDGGTAGGMSTFAGNLNNVTAAITSLTLTMTVGQFMADSSFYLYGW